MAAFLFSPLAPCKLLCLVLGRVRKKEQFLAAVMLVVSGSGRISKLTFYSRFPSLVSLTFPTRTSRCCSNESGNSSPHGRLNLQRSGSQLQGSIKNNWQSFNNQRDNYLMNGPHWLLSFLLFYGLSWIVRISRKLEFSNSSSQESFTILEIIELPKEFLLIWVICINVYFIR